MKLERVESIMGQIASGKRVNAADYFAARDELRVWGRAEGPNPSIASLMRQQPGRGRVSKRMPRE